MNGLGVACFYLKEGEEAKYYFNKCVSMQQKEQNINYNPLYNLGNLLYEQKRYHESLDIFYRCLKNNQSQTKYMRRLADTLLSLKRYEEAKEYYKNALKIFPNPYYRNGLAICLLNENNNEQSETEVDNVMDNYGIRIPLPDNLLDEIGKLTMEGKNSIVESLTIKAFILLRTNRRKAAIIYIDTAIKIIDKYNLEIVVPLFFKAIFFINNKDYDDGLDLFVEIIKRKDNFAEAYHGAGICCCNLGDDKKGVEFFQSALQLKPELTPAYLHKQQVYSQKSNSNVFDFISYWTKTRMRGFIFILLVTFAFFTVILSVLNPSIQITDVENRTAIDNHVITTKTDYNNTFVFLSLIIGTILLIIWPSVKNFKVGTSTFELEKIEYPEKLNDLSLDWVDIDLILRNSITI
jgi:tetratricopeptide (TPR) repeat protein